MNRRQFLKASFFAAAAVSVSMRLSYANPVIKKQSEFEYKQMSVDTADNDYLSKFGVLYGVSRMPSETDDSLRKRILDRHFIRTK